MAQDPSEIGRATDSAAGTSTTPASAPTSDEIRSDIEQTRTEMSETIDAIQARLSPRRLVDDVKETVKEATVGRVERLTQRSMDNGGASTIGDLLHAARRNPIAVAVAGVTATAVLLRALKRSRNRTHSGRMKSRTRVPTQSRFRSNGISRNTGQFVAGVFAGLAWGALRARRSAMFPTAAETGFIADDSDDSVGRTFPGTPRS